MESTEISPFVVADAYRIGRDDGFKAGIAAGVVIVVLAKAALKNRKKSERARWTFFNQK